MLTAFLLRGLTGKIIIGLALLVLAVAVAGGAATLAGNDPLTVPGDAATGIRACSYAEQLPPPGDAGLGLTTPQKTNAATITRLAAELGLPAQAAVIAVATAWTESHLDQTAVGDHGHAFVLCALSRVAKPSPSSPSSPRRR